MPIWPEFKRIIPSALRGSVIGSFMGILPGPNMIAGHPDLSWGLVAGMWVGNVFLITLNVPLVRYWLSVFKIPYAVLFPSILFFVCIGTYSVNNNLDHILITAVFGFIGYMVLRLDLDAAPLMPGFMRETRLERLALNPAQ